MAGSSRRPLAFRKHEAIIRSRQLLHLVAWASAERGDVDDDEVLEVARRELAVFEVPRYVVRSETPLPRMASGKLAKRQLRGDYADVPRRSAAETGP